MDPLFRCAISALTLCLLISCGGDGQTPLVDGAPVDGAVDGSPLDGVPPGMDGTPPTDNDLGAVTTPDGAPPYEGSFPPTVSEFSSATLRVAGFARDVTLYLPEGLPSSPPLVIVLHGTGGNAQDAIWSMEADQLADREKVVIAAPQARSMTTGDWDDHEAGQVFFETYPSINSSTNADLLLVRAIIAEAVRAYGVNPRRVYTMGFSNGAFFSLLCAAAMPDRIAGFAEMSGGLVRCDTMGECSFR
ncbi:MAG: hypothetical protein JRH20_19430, partial [Deltaproteobacteria bacterium]|nr:hypothetical protein [Deltaproteobacteria bacterium]